MPAALSVDEKELFVIKLCAEGKPIFHVISLGDAAECNAEGIKESMGMCSDGAMVSCLVYNLLLDEFGEQYSCILCPSHKFELLINDVFGSSFLSNITGKDYIEV